MPELKECDVTPMMFLTQTMVVMNDVVTGTFDGGCVLRCWLKHVNVRDNSCSSYVVDFL